MPKKKEVKKIYDRMKSVRRNALLEAVWDSNDVSRLNQVLDTGYCGGMTVREFTAVVLADTVNFPLGIDTPISIGDFEGNSRSNVLSISTGGDKSDHVCIMGGV